MYLVGLAITPPLSVFGFFVVVVCFFFFTFHRLSRDLIRAEVLIAEARRREENWVSL